ncbi:hypothetical protein [Muricauda sp. MAR_2010_75]|uniref:hypothetical protein n=1 Tax=Allomuricauda sp. MAR_2010_75 TaxID=1250232 RepID=UPI0005604046|nr:hypothetical protein [Muricauda sp. MAR_2010_75]
MAVKNPSEHIRQINDHLFYLDKVNTNRPVLLEDIKNYWRGRLRHYKEEQQKLDAKVDKDGRVFKGD